MTNIISKVNLINKQTYKQKTSYTLTLDCYDINSVNSRKRLFSSLLTNRLDWWSLFIDLLYCSLKEEFNLHKET